MSPSPTNKSLAVHSITMATTVREFWYTFKFWQVATASFIAGQSWSFTSETASRRDFDRIWGLRAKGQARGFPLEGRISLCVCKRESSLERYASILFRETLHTTAVLCTTYHIYTPYLHQKNYFSFVLKVLQIVIFWKSFWSKETCPVAIAEYLIWDLAKKPMLSYLN